MVQFTLIPLAIVAGLASFGAARNCTPNLDYCGSTLFSIGDYSAQVGNALDDADQTNDSLHQQNSVFRCTGGPNGQIEFVEYCTSGCQNAGEGNSDTC